jgi:hypothetical protein
MLKSIELNNSDDTNIYRKFPLISHPKMANMLQQLLKKSVYPGEWDDAAQL